ncbi:GNAT domain-containing protein [Mrakia frigida]|uniref:GNAT family N-acetyltransferase n=1 Tax=Mrakia frigida TaxID=29902 RepID=UPI003FCBEEBD
MRTNENTVLVGRNVLLVPYKKSHVATYHEWMKSPELLETTASEPLSETEEYEMQRNWHLDEDKLTFIVLARPSTSLDSNSPIPPLTPEELAAAPMIGDVNLFLHPPEEEGDLGDVECEVMIAELAYRRKHLAQQALSLLLQYATSAPLSLPASRNFVAKISTSNPASLALFRKLGFGIVKISEVWQEWEVRFHAKDIETGVEGEGEWMGVEDGVRGVYEEET